MKLFKLIFIILAILILPIVSNAGLKIGPPPTNYMCAVKVYDAEGKGILIISYGFSQLSEQQQILKISLEEAEAQAATMTRPIKARIEAIFDINKGQTISAKHFGQKTGRDIESDLKAIPEL